MAAEHIDVIVVGAGISGICAGYYLQTQCPDRSYAILEGRDVLGGTWDLFRYPGIRSDSDMFTLGYSFFPWPKQNAIAEGGEILQYLHDTSQQFGIDKQIRFGQRVTQASWSSESKMWTLIVQRTSPSGNETIEYTCHFLFMCSGYYNYEQGYTPEFEGIQDFQGELVHPQKWTDDIQYKDKRIIVIGSGATAMTLVPALAKQASHVTMLQRSPTYVVSRPANDPIAGFLQRWLPRRAAYFFTRWKNILFSIYIYRMSKKKPAKVKEFLLQQLRKELGEEFDVETHFTPDYNPWDQRICLVPDGDLFKAINDKQVTVVTDHIKHFTETGISLASGQQLDADMIVTATGLNLLFLGGMQLDLDGVPFDQTQSMTYRGSMFENLPNLALAAGYTNASWTLKCELTCDYVCRILNHMKAHGYTQCVPKQHDSSVTETPFMALQSGYIKRSMHQFPKQGSKTPWRLHQHYIKDLFGLRYNKLEDGAMTFSK
jgi:cation diffusion facilitator CzcD-associated flavoprotein CzcO